MNDDTSVSTDLRVLADCFRVLADQKRLLILNLIMSGVQCNCDLGEALGLAPNLISHHLGILREAGLVDMTRDVVDARWVYYSVNRAALEELNAMLCAFLSPTRIEERRATCGPQSVCPPGA